MLKKIFLLVGRRHSSRGTSCYCCRTYSFIAFGGPLTFIFLALFVFFAPALATQTHKAVFVVDQASYIVDGQVKLMDAKTFIENGRTYVPVRYLGDALGASTEWNENEKTVTIILGGTAVKLVIGSKILDIYKIGRETKQMDVTPVVRDGRTYLPARWIAEAFGYEVKWEPESMSVLIIEKPQKERKIEKCYGEVVEVEPEKITIKSEGGDVIGKTVTFETGENTWVKVGFEIVGRPGKKIDLTSYFKPGDKVWISAIKNNQIIGFLFRESRPGEKL